MDFKSLNSTALPSVAAHQIPKQLHPGTQAEMCEQDGKQPLLPYVNGIDARPPTREVVAKGLGEQAGGTPTPKVDCALELDVGWAHGTKLGDFDPFATASKGTAGRFEF